MRSLLKILLIMLVLIIAVTIAAIIFVRSDSGVKWLKSQAISAAKDSGIIVKIDQLHAQLPEQLQANKVTLADAEGIWLEISNFNFDWNPWALLDDTISIHTLKAQQINFTRLPNLPEAQSKSNVKPFNLDDLPLIKVDNLALPNIILPAKWAEGEELTASASISGSLRNLQANLTLSQNARQLMALKLNREENIIIKGEGTFPVALAKQLKLPTTDWKINAKIIEQNEVWQLPDAEFNLGNISILATVNYDANSQEFSDSLAQLVLPELAPWNTAMGINATGGLNTTITLDGSLEAAKLRLIAKSDALTLEGNEIKNLSLESQFDSDLQQWINEGWATAKFGAQLTATALENPVTIEMNGEVGQSKDIAINSFKAITPFGDATGKLSYNIENTQLDSSVKIDKLFLSTLSNGNYKGAVSTRFKANGTVDNMRLTGDGLLSNLSPIPENLQSWLKPKTTIKFDALYKSTQIKINHLAANSGDMILDITGTIPLTNLKEPTTAKALLKHKNYPDLVLSSTILRDKNMLTLNRLSLNTRDANLKGNITFNTENSLATGALKFESPNIGSLGDWINMPQSSGSANIDITLEGKTGKQAMHANAKLAALRLPSKSLAVESLSLQASLADLTTPEAINLSLQAKNLSQEKLILTNINATAIGQGRSEEMVRFTAQTDGTNDGQKLNLSLGGTVQVDSNKRNIRVNQLTGEYATLPFNLTQTALLKIDDQSISLTNFAMKIAEGSLKVDLSKNATNATGKVALNSLPLKNIAESFAISLPEGEINALMKLQGQAKAPQIDLTTTTKLKPVDEESKPLTLTTLTNWKNNSITAALETKLNVILEDELVTGNVSLPATLSLEPFAFKLANNAPLDGEIKAAFSLKAIDRLTKLYGHKLTGDVDALVNITGSLSKPAAKGYLNLVNSNYDNQAFGLCLREINLDAQFDTQSLQVNSFTAKGNHNQGTMNATAKVNFDHSNVESAVTLSKLSALCEGLATGEISGDIGVNGTFKNLLAKGKLELSPLVITMPTSGTTEIPLIDAVTREEFEATEITKEEGIIKLAIDLSFPQKLYVRGRGLDAEFAGNIALEGNSNSPEIEGRLATKRGTLELLGSRLKINEGTIRFLDKSPINPYINIAANSLTNGKEILVELEGLVKSPQINLSSVPTLPQDEVLALLLFGRPIQKISPFQALQLAKAAATLAGKDSGPSALGLLRDTIGLDSLTINQDENGETTVGAEKYITDRVYVGVEQGATPESRKIKTEIEITPDITAETSTGVQSGPTVGVEWRYDY